MEDNHKPELLLYKTINKYFKEYGHERGMLILDKIVSEIGKKHGPSRMSDDSMLQKTTNGATIHEMMEEEESIESIGDSLIHSERFNQIIEDTYASDFENEFEYVDNILNELISDYQGSSMETELMEYLEDVYGESLIDLYNSGDDDYKDSDNDLEYFV